VTLRILLVLVAFAVLYGCGQESSPIETREQAAGEERSAPASDPQPVPDQQSQDEALQTYFDQMSTLPIDEDLGDANGDRAVRTLARARTLTVLEKLDPTHKRQVMQFLVDASLVQSALSGIVMHGTRRVGADLRDANLNGTILHDANLSGANLSHATGKTADQLDGQAGSLDGANMPNGQKYEDWLIDREGR
jgi:uncharacterized protein YjbI with pentapeptide repeats